MGLFNRNPNEVAYVGGKKHWTDVIKNSGSGELLIWRQPEEDFNTNSTLIVMPGEEALFINGGVIEQRFEEPGTYKLTTNNYPFISRLRNAFSGGVSVFNCVVYFVRKAHSAEIMWGTDSPIQVRDKVLGISTKLKARGAYKIQISNPAIFLDKLIGNNVPFQTQQELNKYFINEFQSKIKSSIARAVNESNTELLGIDAQLDEMSDMVQPFIQEILDDYGLRCVKFTIGAIDIDDDELRRRYDEIHIGNIETLSNAQAEAQAEMITMEMQGDAWAKLQSASILRDLANNPGAGGAASAGAGIGMGIGAAGVFSSMAQQMFVPLGNNAPTPQKPVTQAPSGRFSTKPATATSTTPLTQATTSGEDPIETLSKLKRMLDAGLIEQYEYDAKKAEILSRM